MRKIKAVISDVDGVMVGKTVGVNFPLPNDRVIARLKQVAHSGIPIILCTAKFNYAIKQIALQAQLNNPHITDGGALIINFDSHTILKQYPINKKILSSLVTHCLNHAIYCELYTADCYFIQKNQRTDFVTKRTALLQIEPTIVPSLKSIIEQYDIIKCICFAPNASVQSKIDQLVHPYATNLNLIWSYHPYMEPMRPAIITAHAVSKAHAAQAIIQSLGIPFEQVLGIGDSMSDWNFMDLCACVGVVGNDTDTLQQLANTKGSGNYFFGRDVNDHGILEILDYYKL